MISSVLPRKGFHFQLYRKELNDILRELCKMFNFIFIENDNIWPEFHLVEDGVHLNDKGSKLLCKNFQDALYM